MVLIAALMPTRDAIGAEVKCCSFTALRVDPHAWIDLMHDLRFYCAVINIKASIRMPAKQMIKRRGGDEV